MTNHELIPERQFSNKVPLVIEDAAYAENDLFDIEETIRADLLQAQEQVSRLNRQIERQIAQEFSELVSDLSKTLSEAEYIEKYRQIVLKSYSYGAIGTLKNLERMIEFREVLQPDEPILVTDWRDGKLSVFLGTLHPSDELAGNTVRPSAIERKGGPTVSSWSTFELSWEVSTREGEIITITESEVIVADDEEPSIFVGKDAIIAELATISESRQGILTYSDVPTLTRVAAFYDENGLLEEAQRLRVAAADLAAYKLDQYARDNSYERGDDIRLMLITLEEHNSKAYQAFLDKVRRSAAAYSSGYADNVLHALIANQRGDAFGTRPLPEVTPIDRLEMKLKLAKEGEKLLEQDRAVEVQARKKMGNAALI